MGKENSKDFNLMLNNNKNMPKIVELDDMQAKKWGGKTMIIAPPLYYDALIKKIPKRRLVTIKQIRENVAKNNNVDITCPLTAGIFINIVAWASYQRKNDITPFWRVLKTDGQLNPKFPENIQKELLEKEGHTIISKGTKNIKYYVKDYENSLIEL